MEGTGRARYHCCCNGVMGVREETRSQLPLPSTRRGRGVINESLILLLQRRDGSVRKDSHTVNANNMMRWG